MPSRQVSRKALTCSGSRVMWSLLPSDDVATGGRPLEIRVEADAVWRVDIDALHLAAQTFALGEARHDRQAVAEDHPVRPVGVVLIELGHGLLVGQAIEIGEQVRHWRVCHFAPLPALAQQVVDQHLRVHLLPDVERGAWTIRSDQSCSSLPRQTS